MDGTVDLNFLGAMELFELLIPDKKTVRKINGTFYSWSVGGVMITS